MRAALKVAAAGFLSLAFCGGAGQAVAATIVLTPNTPFAISTANTYVDGNTTFNFTSCSSCSGLQIESLFNGRNGTEIEILKSSAIFSNSAGANNSALSFTLNVTINPGNGGISSVTNILQGSTTLAANRTAVTSVLSNFTGVTGAVGTPSSNLTNTTSSEVFDLLAPTRSFSFVATLSDLSKNATKADTLVLSNVKLLFAPAPEPASIGLLATGVLGLAAVRRRFTRRGGRAISP
jgi:hypothetical protein